MHASFIIVEVVKVDVRLSVDGKEMVLNEFIKKMMSGMVIEAVMSLRDVKESWKEIRIEVKSTG